MAEAGSAFPASTELEVLMPGWGERPDEIAPAEANLLRSTPDELNQGLDWVALLPALVLAMIGNQEIYNAYIIWGNTNYNLAIFGQAMPVTWLISIDAGLGAIVLLAVIAGWRWWERTHAPVREITKLTLGAFSMAVASAILALASLYEQASGKKIGLAWALAFHIVNSIGFSNLFPVGLALFSRAAPRAVAGLMIGVFYLHLFVGNMVVGWLGGLLEVTPPVRFWLLHAALICGGGCLMLLLRAAFGRQLAPTVDPEAGSV